MQAWLRKLLLFATASQERGIDLGTGDLSEIALGWCTYGGDHMSHYAVNAGVPKTLISYLIGWAADVIFADDAAVQEVLRDILATPISPELLRPRDGEIVQRSEDIVGPYELHDFFLYHLLRFGSGPRRMARLALHAFDGRYDLGDHPPLAAGLRAPLLRQPVQARLRCPTAPRSAPAAPCRRAATGACRPTPRRRCGWRKPRRSPSSWMPTERSCHVRRAQARN